VASMPTTWRMLDRIDDAHLPGVLTARAQARDRAWTAGAGPDLSGLLQIDFDATVTISHSEDKENAAKTWKKTFGFHPLLAFLDRPEVSGGEALAGLLRPGNAGSNTAADHVTVLERALDALPAQARPRRGAPGSVRVVARSDSAGATHAFAKAWRDRGVWFSFGVPRRHPDPADCRPGPGPRLGIRHQQRHRWWRDPRWRLGRRCHGYA
jgi:hypothetical protein